jgi:hypothetical protein
MVNTGMLYRWAIQYTLLGPENRKVPSPTTWQTNWPRPSASAASLMPSAAPPDQPRPPAPQLIQEPGRVGRTLSWMKPVLLTASTTQMVSSGQAARSCLLR